MTISHRDLESDTDLSSRKADQRPDHTRTKLSDIEITLSSEAPVNGLGWSLSHFGPRRRDMPKIVSSELRNCIFTRTWLEGRLDAECLSDQDMDANVSRLIRSRYLEDGPETSDKEHYMFEIRARLELVRDWFGHNMPEDIRRLVDGASEQRLYHARPIPAHLHRSLSASLKSPHPMRNHLVGAVAVQILDFQLENVISEDQATLSTREIGIVKEVLACLESSPEDPPSVMDLAALFKIPATRLDTAYRVFFGSTIHQAVLDIRFRAICNALLCGEPVKVVAHRFGYSSVSNFTSAFRRHVGAPPREWLEQQG